MLCAFAQISRVLKCVYLFADATVDAAAATTTMIAAVAAEATRVV